MYKIAKGWDADGVPNATPVGTVRRGRLVVRRPGQLPVRGGSWYIPPVFEGKGRWSVSRVVCALSFFLAMTAPIRAAAQQEDVELTARTHFAEGDYKAALEIYAQLYAKTLHPTYLRNVGRCYQNMGEPDKAISAFREYLRKAENLEPKHRAEVEGFIREMEDLKREHEAQRAPGIVPASPSPAPATPSLSPAPPSAPPPAARRGDESSGIEASLRTTESPGAQDRESSPVYARWWFWTAIAAVAAGSVVAAVALSSGSGTPTASTTFGTKSVNPQ